MNSIYLLFDNRSSRSIVALFRQTNEAACTVALPFSMTCSSGRFPIVLWLFVRYWWYRPWPDCIWLFAHSPSRICRRAQQLAGCHRGRLCNCPTSSDKQRGCRKMLPSRDTNWLHPNTIARLPDSFALCRSCCPHSSSPRRCCKRKKKKKKAFWKIVYDCKLAQ